MSFIYQNASQENFSSHESFFLLTVPVKMCKNIWCQFKIISTTWKKTIQTVCVLKGIVCGWCQTDLSFFCFMNSLFLCHSTKKSDFFALSVYTKVEIWMSKTSLESCLKYKKWDKNLKQIFLILVNISISINKMARWAIPWGFNQFIINNFTLLRLLCFH